MQSLGCLRINGLAGFPPVTRFEPGLSILPRELTVIALDSFRSAIRVTVVLKFRRSCGAQRQIRYRDEMNLRIKVAAIFQIVGSEFRIRRSRWCAVSSGKAAALAGG